MVFELKSIRENIWTIIIHHISKKISSIFSIHTSRKIAYTKMYKDSKINQSIFKSSWVHNLAKCMHVICENNERYDCKTARWIQKTMQCMWILNINDAWKNQISEKTKQFNAKTSQSTIFHEWNAWVWD